MNYRYMPHFIDSQGQAWNVLECIFVIDAAGRGVDLECAQEGSEEAHTTTFSYRHIPIPRFTTHPLETPPEWLKNLFDYFAKSC